MGDKIQLELHVKSLEKSMVTILKAVKEIKSSVVKLEEKVDKTHNDEIQEIINAQKNLEDVIALNSEAIKRKDKEILRMQNDKAEADPAVTNRIKRQEMQIFCENFSKVAELSLSNEDLLDKLDSTVDCLFGTQN